MKKLDFYLYKAVVGPTLLALAVAAFIGVGNEFREESRRVFVGAAIRLADIAYLSVLFLPALLPYILPAALLVGTLLGFGRLAERGEIVAMRASGVSLRRLLAPALMLAFVFSAACYIVQEQVQPRAMGRANEFVTQELPSRVTIATLDPGVMHRFANWRVYFRDRDDRTKTLYDVDIVRYEEMRGAWYYHARWAGLTVDEAGAALDLNDGHLVTPDNIRLRFDSQTLRVPSRVVEAQSKSIAGMSLTDLYGQERSLTESFEAGNMQVERALRKVRLEIAKRLTLPSATFALAMVGAPLSVAATQSRRSGRMREFTTGLIILVGFYVLLELFRPRELTPLSEAIGRLLLVNICFLVLGGAFIFRLGRGR